MKFPPDIIYLQICNEWGEEADEISWCEDRIYATDLAYVVLDPIEKYLLDKELKDDEDYE